MYSSIITIGLAFIEGFALIISPCILPILPIILSGSLTGSKARPLGIVTGFVIAFSFVTLFSKILVDSFHVNSEFLRNASFIILLMLGVMMISTYLTEKFNLLTQRLTSVGSSIQTINDPQSGFGGGVLFGGLIGIIWTPCAGPILAVVIVQVVLQQTGAASILTVLAFAIGAAVPMLLIALMGRELMNQFPIFRNYAGLFRKILGVIIIASVVFLYYDTGASIAASSSTSSQVSGTALVNGLDAPYAAPNIDGIDAWINSSPLQMSDLRGKVVLIDFWTYSCINCLRTLPYLKEWYAKYHDQGFEIIGVHSPEFQFEHDLNNVKMAVAKLGILYPVALDNNFVTWRLYHNEYWPAHYLINQDGMVVYTHFGEGEYDVTENNIRYLLGLRGNVSNAAHAEKYFSQQTPETYLGYSRMEHFAGPEKITKDAVALYAYPSSLRKNEWALKGSWIVKPQSIVNVNADAAIKIHFYAKQIYVVMGNSGAPIDVKIFLNGKVVTDAQGPDVINGQVNVTHNQLYSVINLKQEGEGTLEIVATAPGLELYTFTFGG